MKNRVKFLALVILSQCIMIVVFLSGFMWLNEKPTDCPVECPVPIPVEVVVEAEPEICVTATCYNPTAAQCNSEYWITASGSKIDTLNPLKHRWIAISRDLEEQGITLNDTVQITGIGNYSRQWIIKDRMNKRWKNKIDLLVGETDYIAKWTEVTITVN